jgi:hypothetical protein
VLYIGCMDNSSSANIRVVNSGLTLVFMLFSSLCMVFVMVQAMKKMKTIRTIPTPRWFLVQLL